MPVDVILGAQWGDEGKGKISSLVSEGAEFCARFQGGPNAGHTAFTATGRPFILRTLPAGALRAEQIVLGNGVTINIGLLLQEIDLVRPLVPDLEERLFISERAHVIINEQVRRDGLQDKARIGTTGMGVGPCMVDKYSRLGLRVGDLFSNKQDSEIDIDREIVDRFCTLLQRNCQDTGALLRSSLAKGATVVAEGGQGTSLDVDHGDYPYVTASNTTIGAAVSGLGVTPSSLRQVILAASAYLTKLGRGPFPTRMVRALEERFRDVGREWDSSRAEYRMCGWLDVDQLRYAAELNGATGLVLSKIDVLSGLDYVNVRVDGHLRRLDGWKEQLHQCRRDEDLPVATRRYIEILEEWIGIPIIAISLGAAQENFYWRA